MKKLIIFLLKDIQNPLDRKLVKPRELPATAPELKEMKQQVCLEERDRYG